MQLLNALEEGDRHVAENLPPSVYEELRRLAASKMSRKRSVKPLQYFPLDLTTDCSNQIASQRTRPCARRLAHLRDHRRS